MSSRKRTARCPRDDKRLDEMSRKSITLRGQRHVSLRN